MSWSRVIFGLSFLVLISIWIFTALTQPILPETIPIHFDGSGNPDGYGSKRTNWLIPVIAACIFGFMVYMWRNPYSILLNVPEKMRNNKKFIHLFVGVLSLVLMSVFLIGEISSFEVAMGRVNNLNFVFGLSIGTLLITLIAFMAYASYHE